MGKIYETRELTNDERRILDADRSTLNLDDRVRRRMLERDPELQHEMQSRRVGLSTHRVRSTESDGMKRGAERYRKRREADANAKPYSFLPDDDGGTAA